MILMGFIVYNLMESNGTLWWFYGGLKGSNGI